MDVRAHPGRVLAPLLRVHDLVVDRRSEQPERRDRGPEVVRDRLQEGVLHLVQRSEPCGRFLLRGKRFHELGLGVLLLGHVVHHTL